MIEWCICYIVFTEECMYQLYQLCIFYICASCLRDRAFSSQSRFFPLVVCSTQFSHGALSSSLSLHAFKSHAISNLRLCCSYRLRCYWLPSICYAQSASCISIWWYLFYPLSYDSSDWQLVYSTIVSIDFFKYTLFASCMHFMSLGIAEGRIFIF